MNRANRIRLGLALVLAAGVLAAVTPKPSAAQQRSDARLPSHRLTFGVFVARFDPGGTFTLEGAGWPALGGNWKTKGDEVELTTSAPPKGCGGPGRYRVRADAGRLRFALVADDCVPRRMILDRSTWA